MTRPLSGTPPKTYFQSRYRKLFRMRTALLAALMAGESPASAINRQIDRVDTLIEHVGASYYEAFVHPDEEHARLKAASGNTEQA